MKININLSILNFNIFYSVLAFESEHNDELNIIEIFFLNKMKFFIFLFFY